MAGTGTPLSMLKGGGQQPYRQGREKKMQMKKKGLVEERLKKHGGDELFVLRKSGAGRYGRFLRQ